MALAAVRTSFENRWDDAENLCECALKVQPGHASAYMVRGMALLCQGNIERAESSLRRSAELDPLSAGDCARMAYLHYLKGDCASAVEHLQQSFDLDRDYPEARFYQGLLHFQQEDYKAVVQCLSPSPFPLDIGLLAAAHARQGGLPEAEETLERLGRLATTQYVTHLAQALAAVGLKAFELAFQRLDEAIDHKTNFVNCWGSSRFLTRSGTTPGLRSS